MNLLGPNHVGLYLVGWAFLVAWIVACYKGRSAELLSDDGVMIFVVVGFILWPLFVAVLVWECRDDWALLLPWTYWHSQEATHDDR